MSTDAPPSARSTLAREDLEREVRELRARCARLEHTIVELSGLLAAAREAGLAWTKVQP